MHFRLYNTGMDEDNQKQASQGRKDIPSLIASVAILALMLYGAYQLGQRNPVHFSVSCQCKCQK